MKHFGYVMRTLQHQISCRFSPKIRTSLSCFNSSVSQHIETTRSGLKNKSRTPQFLNTLLGVDVMKHSSTCFIYNVKIA